jgi:hypothetical protein
MINKHSLDTVISQVEKAEASAKNKAKSSTERVIIVDKQKKEILQKIPFLSGQNIVYYIVSNTNDASKVAERTDLPIEVRDFAQNRKLGISVAYRASCPSGKEQQVALALCGDDSPGDELDRKIKRWVAELTDERTAEFIDNYFGRVERLQNDLKEKARNEVGLKLDFRLSLDKEKQLESVKIGPTKITVYVSDSDEALELQLQTELIVDDPVIATSNLASGWLISLVKITKEEIKKYLLERTTISQFYYELKDTIRNGLVKHLDSVLREKGRRVGYLYLDSQQVSSSPVPKELVEIQSTVDCRVQKYAGLVSVENTLQMLPQDVRRYISAQSPNLKAWVENKLERIIKPLLLDKKYVNILLDFHKESEEIRRAMQVEAESIGYEVQHIVSLPKLEHLTLKENLEIRDGKDREFSTNAASIKVKLSTTANIKFENFEKIEDYLVKIDEENQLVSRSVREIKDLIIDTINSTTREILRTVDPERFYMRYYESATGEKSVEQELVEAISKAIEERFGAKVLRVVPIPEQTDIVDYLQRLMGMVGSFQCEVPSLTGGDPVKFQGDFKILAIEQGSWYIFQSAFQSMRESQQELLQELEALKEDYSNVIDLGDVEDSREELQKISQRIRTIENEIFGMDNIKISIEKSVNAKLTTADSQLLRYTDMKLLSTMERYINQWARESVVEQYGLEINIRNLSRTRTDEEEYLFTVQQQLERAKVDEALAQVEARKEQRQKQLEMSSRRNQAQADELNKLYELRVKLIVDSDADPDELKHLNEQIKRLEKEVLSSSLENAENSLNILEPKRDKVRSILAFEEQMSLPSSQNNPDSNSSNHTSTPNQ